jgi:hypothetical protein
MTAAMQPSLATDGLALMKDALPLRPLLAVSAVAVDHFLIRRLPGKAQAELGLDKQLTRLIELVALGRAGAEASRYFAYAAGTTKFIVPERGLRFRSFLPEPQLAETLPFHQDAYAFPIGWRLLTCWCLLYPTELSSCAGLAFVPSAASSLLPLEATPKHPTRSWMELDHAAVAEMRDTHGEWRPDIEIGDVMMFNELVLHRTVHDKVMQIPRLSVEIRLIALTDAVRAEYARNGIAYYIAEDSRLLRCG